MRRFWKLAAATLLAATAVAGYTIYAPVSGMVNGITQDGRGTEQLLEFADTMEGIVGPNPNEMRIIYFSTDAAGDIIQGVDNEFCTLAQPCLTWAKAVEIAAGDSGRNLWIIFESGDTWTIAAGDTSLDFTINTTNPNELWGRVSSSRGSGLFPGGTDSKATIACDAALFPSQNGGVIEVINTSTPGHVVVEDLDMTCDAPGESGTDMLTSNGDGSLWVVNVTCDQNSDGPTEQCWSAHDDANIWVIGSDCNSESECLRSVADSFSFGFGGTWIADGAGNSASHAIDISGQGGTESILVAGIRIEADDAGNAAGAEGIDCRGEELNQGSNFIGMQLVFADFDNTNVDTQAVRCNSSTANGVTRNFELLMTTIEDVPRGIWLGNSVTMGDDSTYVYNIDGVMSDTANAVAGAGIHLRVDGDTCDLAGGVTGSTVTGTIDNWTISVSQGDDFRTGVPAANFDTWATFAARIAECTAAAAGSTWTAPTNSNDHGAIAACVDPTSGETTTDTTQGCRSNTLSAGYTRSLFGKVAPAWVFGRELRAMSLGYDGHPWGAKK